ncbi:hypothetical protein [Burkholderia territorii]|uniref:hypothetical protein n=1 Tax=Burkholderia territorii TaxID=1503055 RepID=UPI0012D8C848|nr:hypothetical protein [Burkholderia territorii]
MPTQTYRRIDLALAQLDAALRLFLECRAFAAVITLAGAAEEILGKEVGRCGLQIARDRRLDPEPELVPVGSGDFRLG